MPIYEYTCSSCGHTTDILHGINEPTPPFCPECGAEGTLRKAFAPPAIVFKGTGWAKKDRAATRRPGSGRTDASESGDGKSGESGPGDGTSKTDGGTASTSTSNSASSTSSSSGSAAD